MAHHAAPRSPRRLKRLAIPLVAGLVVIGGVTAFAASLSVSSKTLGSGNATMTSCNATAAVSYNTVYSATVPGYKVSTAPVVTAAACNGLAYKVTLTGASNAALGEVNGFLDASGNASPDFSLSNIAASAVTGVSVVVTG
jgi:hypothetical protein